jgi:histidyl-tRNA synthetase
LINKIGEDGEMIEKGIEAEAIEKVQLFNFTGTITEKIEKLGQLWLLRRNEGY